MKYLKKIAVLILVMSLFIAFFACENPFAPPSLEKGNAPAYGKGYISLSFGGNSSARSIKPVTPSLEAMRYDITFSSGDTVVNPDDRYFIHEDFSSGAITFDLDAGNYKLVVLAFEFSDILMERPIAKYEDPNLRINFGDEIDLPISLKAIISDDDAGAVGSFKWEIDENAVDPSDIRVKMYLQQLDPATNFSAMIGKDRIYLIGSATTTEVLDGKETGTRQNLPIGFYDFFLVMESEGKTVTIYEVLYIFKNLESVYDTLTITGNTFAANQYLVTFLDHDGSLLSYGSVAHGDAESLYLPSNPANKPRFNFNRWYTNDARTIPWTEESPVTGHMTLYAGYTPGTTTSSFPFDSNDLIVIPGAQKGWWAETVTGRWRVGYMLETTEGVPLEVPAFERSYLRAELNNHIATTTLPGGIGTFSATRLPATGTTNLIRKAYGTMVLQNLRNPTNDFDHYYIGSNTIYGTPSTATTNDTRPPGLLTDVGFLFNFNMNIPIKPGSIKVSLHSAFPSDAGETGSTGFASLTAAQRVNRVAAQNMVYMIDYPNPGLWPEFVFDDFEIGGDFTHHTTANNHNGASSWFTFRPNAVVTVNTANTGFDTNEIRPGSSGKQSLRLSWSQTSGTAANSEVRIGRRIYEPLNASDCTHIKFWAKTTSPGQFSVIFRIGDNNDRVMNFDATGEWQEFTLALTGTTAQRNNIIYLAFRSMRGTTAIGTTQNPASLWIDDVSFVNPANYTHSNPGYIVMTGHGAVTPQRTFKIEFEADSTHVFIKNDVRFIDYEHPVFERGSGEGASFVSGGINYWRDNDGKDTWSLETDTVARFKEFDDTNVEHEQSGTIVVRMPDISQATPANWIPDDDGPDTEDIPIDPSQHYRVIGPTPVNMTGFDYPIWTIKIELRQHHGSPVSRVDIKATYEIDPRFVPYIGSMTYGGVPVSGSGTTRTVEINDVMHGEYNLRTDITWAQ